MRLPASVIGSYNAAMIRGPPAPSDAPAVIGLTQPPLLQGPNSLWGGGDTSSKLQAQQFYGKSFFPCKLSMICRTQDKHQCPRLDTAGSAAVRGLERQRGFQARPQLHPLLELWAVQAPLPPLRPSLPRLLPLSWGPRGPRNLAFPLNQI